MLAEDEIIKHLEEKTFHDNDHFTDLSSLDFNFKKLEIRFIDYFYLYYEEIMPLHTLEAREKQSDNQ